MYVKHRQVQLLLLLTSLAAFAAKVHPSFGFFDGR
jgi:hypothetical protein